MPARNGTGPEGKGPMTGRGMGNCNTNKDISETNNNFVGLGRRRQGGLGQGLGRGFGSKIGRSRGRRGN